MPVSGPWQENNLMSSQRSGFLELRFKVGLSAGRNQRGNQNPYYFHSSTIKVY